MSRVWGARLRAMAAVVCALGLFLVTPGHGPALAQQASDTSGLLDAKVPAGKATVDRLRTVLDQVRQLPEPYRSIIPARFARFAESASNSWTYSGGVSALGQQLNFTATIAVAPQDPAAGEALLRIDATLGTNIQLPAGLTLKQGTLTMVVSPTYTVAAALRDVSISMNDATFVADIPLKSGNMGDGSYTLTGNATLGQMFPPLAKAPKVNEIALQSLTVSALQGVQALFALKGKTFTVTGQQGSYRLEATDDNPPAVGDLIPGGDLIPFLSDVKTQQIRITTAPASLSMATTYNNRQVNLHMGSGQFSLTAALPLSMVLPMLQGIPVADLTQLTSVSLDDQKAVFNGSYNGKAVSITRTRGKDATLDIAAGGLGLGDLVHNAAQSGLDQYVQLETIEVAADHVAVDMKVNGNDTEAYVLRNQQGGGQAAFFYFSKLDPATFIPNSDGSGLTGVGLNNALVAFGQTNRTFTQADLPGDLGGKVTLPSGSSFTIAPDAAALTGTFDLSASKTLVSALSAISITQTSFPVNGTFHSDTIRQIPGTAKNTVKTIGNADKSRLLSRLNLSVPMSLPSLPGLDAYVSLGGPLVLAIKGNNDSVNPRADLSGEFPVRMTIDNSEMDLIARLDMDKGLNGQGSASSISIALDKAWSQPFGVPGIVVNSGSFVVDLTNKSVADLSLKGSASYAGKNNVDVTASFVRANDKLSFSYFEFDASQGFPLSGLPGFASIPHADGFVVDTIKLSPSGIEAKTMLSNVHVDAFIFKDATGGAVFAVDQQGLKLVDLLPPLSKTPLKNLKLGNAALIVSENGMSGDPKSVPATAQDLFKDIFGTSNVGLALPKGVALLSRVDFSQSGLVGTALQKIGVHADTAVVMGAVSGLFGSGSPSLSLSIMMDQLGNTTGLPKNMNYKAGSQPGFFINWAGDEVDLGVRTAMMVKAGSDLLEFESSVEATFSDTGVGLEVIGGMDGTWHKPFGIQPLTLSDVKLETSIDVLGNVSLGFKGAQTFGQESLAVATKIKFALEAEGLPDAVAFSGTADVVGPDMLLEIAQAATGGKLDLEKIKLPVFNIKQFNIALATPGATDAQLGLVSEGVAFAGIFNFMGQDLGSVKGSAGTSGLKFDGALTDIAWGPISLKGNNLDVAVSAQPKIVINSNVKVLNAYQQVEVDLTPPTLDITVIEDLGDFGKGELKVDVKAVDLSSGRYIADADFDITGKFQSDLVPRLKLVIKDGARALRDAANGKLNDDMQALKDAQGKVDALNQKIADAKANIDREKQQAQSKIQAAENRVNSLKGELSHDQDRADHCGNRVTHHFCRPYWEVRKAATEAAIAVADGILDAAKAAANVAFDLDPTLLALEAQRDSERLGLSIAMAVVKGSEDVVNAVTGPFQQALDKLLDDIPFTIQEVFFAGDLKQMIERDTPLLLDMQYTLVGNQRRDYLAFKLKDWKFNAESFAILPSLVAEKVVDDLAGSLPPKVSDWLKSHIGTELAAASDDVRDEVMKAETKFENTLQGMETNTGRYQASVDSLTQQRVQTASELGTTDFLGPSQQFDRTYLAVGHSSLCLAVANDGVTVHQENCKDGSTEQWQTRPVDDYVQLSARGLCLQAQDDAAAKDQQGVRLMLKACDANDRDEHWKISTYDNLYSQIVNRASQKCLHFDSENARPETARAVWTSCLGMDSQTFRAIPDAERPTFVAKASALASQDNVCFWFKPNAVIGVYGSGSCAPYGKNQALKANEPQLAAFDYVEMVDGGIKLIHNMAHIAGVNQAQAGDGMCVYGAAGSNFFDQACTRADGLIYDIDEVQQHFMLRQRSSNLCFDTADVQLGPNSISPGPFLKPCDRTRPSQLLRWAPARTDS
ncbi:RICIN domain-containing protein [Ferrovibrio sp.]|uniref:RICIN domain-containing protein n=1 Tax=Ferrovibrio sp. TaxID=1917215 RepID=UPI0026337CFC|nr:ricin-type beta-trefoil lectin domain protein [Ferrovibrio sp.]